MKIFNKSFIVGFGAAAILLLPLFIGFKDQVKEKPISQFVYVDMDKVVNRVSKQILSLNLKPEDSERQAALLREQFNMLVEEFSKRHNKLLYSHPRPINNSRDATDELLKELFKLPQEAHGKSLGAIKRERQADLEGLFPSSPTEISNLELQKE